MFANRLNIVLVFLLLVLAAGCGKKGHLYLPDTQRPAQTGGEDTPRGDRPSLPPPPAAP